MYIKLLLQISATLLETKCDKQNLCVWYFLFYFGAFPASFSSFIPHVFQLCPLNLALCISVLVLPSFSVSLSCFTVFIGWTLFPELLNLPLASFVDLFACIHP